MIKSKSASQVGSAIQFRNARVKKYLAKLIESEIQFGYAKIKTNSE